MSLTNPHFQTTEPPRKQTLEKEERKAWPVAVCAETAPLALLAQQNLGLLSRQPQGSSSLAGWGRGAGLTDNRLSGSGEEGLSQACIRRIHSQ